MGRHVPTSVRKRILARDRHCCQRCGATGVPLEVNHRVPLAEGGTTRDDNLETLCVDCHRALTLAQIERGRKRRNARRRLPATPHPGRV